VSKCRTFSRFCHFSLHFQTESGTGAVTYNLVSGSGTVRSGGIVTITGAGSIIVNATKDADNNYNAVTSADLTITVDKAMPSYTVPTGLTVTYGDLLSSVNILSSDWTWDNPTDFVGNVGVQPHAATFTPADINNYNTVTENVDVTVIKAQVTAPALTETSFIYDGNPHSVTLNPTSAL